MAIFLLLISRRASNALVRYPGFHKPVAQVLFIRTLLIVKRVQKGLDGKSWLPLKHLLNVGAGSRGISQLRQRRGEKSVMAMVRRCQLAERLNRFGIETRGVLSAAKM